VSIKDRVILALMDKLWFVLTACQVLRGQVNLVDS
jgi:hypothetical protein